MGDLMFTEESLISVDKKIVKSICLSSDKKLLLTGGSNQIVQLWDVESGKCIHQFEGHVGWINSVVFFSGGALIASGSFDSSIRIWDVVSGKSIRQLIDNKSTAGVYDVLVSSDNNTLLSSCNDNVIRIWDISVGKQRYVPFSGHAAGVSCVDVCENQYLLASGSNDKTIRIWDIRRIVCINVLSGHKDWVADVVFTKNGKTLYSASYDNTICVWDPREEIMLKKWSEHTDWVHCIALTDDEKILVSGSEDKTVKVWDTCTGNCLSTIKMPGAVHCIEQVVFNNQLYIFAGLDDNTVKFQLAYTFPELKKDFEDFGRELSPKTFVCEMGMKNSRVKIEDTTDIDVIVSREDDSLRSNEDKNSTPVLYSYSAQVVSIEPSLSEEKKSEVINYP